MSKDAGRKWRETRRGEGISVARLIEVDLSKLNEDGTVGEGDWRVTPIPCGVSSGSIRPVRIRFPKDDQ